jgi:hypothetical protein
MQLTAIALQVQPQAAARTVAAALPKGASALFNTEWNKFARLLRRQIIIVHRIQSLQ